MTRPASATGPARQRDGRGGCLHAAGTSSATPVGARLAGRPRWVSLASNLLGRRAESHRFPPDRGARAHTSLGVIFSWESVTPKEVVPATAKAQARPNLKSQAGDWGYGRAGSSWPARRPVVGEMAAGPWGADSAAGPGVGGPEGVGWDPWGCAHP